jgi:hypothetical protein
VSDPLGAALGGAIVCLVSGLPMLARMRRFCVGAGRLRRLFALLFRRRIRTGGALLRAVSVRVSLSCSCSRCSAWEAVGSPSVRGRMSGKR